MALMIAGIPCGAVNAPLKSLSPRNKKKLPRGARREKCTVLWLRSNLRSYLKGFLNRGIMAKAGKDSQKSACGRHEICAFTIFALNIACALRAFTPFLNTSLARKTRRACAPPRRKTFLPPRKAAQAARRRGQRAFLQPCLARNAAQSPRAHRPGGGFEHAHDGNRLPRLLARRELRLHLPQAVLEGKRALLRREAVLRCLLPARHFARPSPDIELVSRNASYSGLSCCSRPPS